MTGVGAKQRANYRQRLLILQDGKCAHCGTADDLTFDHIVPRSRGGRNVFHNFQLLCSPCNQAKGATIPA